MSTSYCVQKESDAIEYFEIPVGDLNMKQLHMLQVWHVVTT